MSDTSALLPERYSCLACGSSDARRKYSDGGSYCFSCKSLFNNEKEAQNSSKSEKTSRLKVPSSKIKKTRIDLPTIEEIPELMSAAIEGRKISQEICSIFGVKISYNENGEPAAHYYPYGDDAYKVRILPKEFIWIPKKNDKLFGQHVKFSGKRTRLTIVEGEIDALSVAQAFYEKYEGRIYPVVSVPSATMLKSLVEQRDWIRSYEEVVIFFDNDEVGREAAKNAARIVGADKAKILTCIRKDANEVLMKDGIEELVYAIFDADTYVPSGIVRKDEVWKQLVEYNNIKSTPFPECIKGLNDKLKGTRRGEITLFISGTGAGKSTMLREMMLDFLEKTDEKIGVISLEESPAETGRKLAGMALKRNPAKEEIPLDDLKIGFEKVFGKLNSEDEERLIILDHQGSVDDSDLMDKLEYMSLMGCSRLFIDHITILVSEGAGRLAGNEAQDKVMNDLLRLCKKHNVWIGLVSHLRKTPSGNASAFEEGNMPSIDDIRGSGSIKQISYDIVAFARDMQAKSDVARNTISLSVLKSRFTGLTGFVDGSRYNYDTGRLEYRPKTSNPNSNNAEFEDESGTITELQ